MADKFHDSENHTSSDPEEDFASMLEASLENAPVDGLEAGELVQGTIVGMDEESLFVDVGAKAEAVLDRSELLDEHGMLTVQTGDTIEAYIIQADENILRLSYNLARRAQDRAQLEEAYRSRLPIEGKVTESVKGGFRVSLGDGSSGFCPISQIELGYCEDPTVHVGHTYSFRITEIKGSGDRADIVLSRKVIQAQERAALAEKLKETLEAGMQLTGVVKNIRPFGAFVDVGGMEGLLHVSEISHARVQDPTQYFHEGQEIEVVVKSYEPEKERLSLTRKPLESSPWSRVGKDFLVGGTYTGTVVRILDFGAFIELAPGLEGLLHVSEISPGKRGQHPSQVLGEGESIEVRIQSVERDRNRISLARVFGEAPDDLPALQAGSVFKGIVDDHADFGTFIVLPGGLGRGLLPHAESDMPRGTDFRKEWPGGTELEVMVLDVEEQKGRTRIRLSRKALEEAREREQFQKYQKSQEPPAADAGLGALGKLLLEKGFKLQGS